MTRKEQIIEQIAGILHEAMSNPEIFTLEDAAKLNEMGFSFNVRWIDRKYKNITGFSKARNIKLDNVDLEKSFNMAESWII